ncbi:MAG: hypothetical protein JW731_10190, partial [Bacteroidales bacterium]|nr:hypothetical protein [Bacteroidales bacterium]
VLITFLYLSYIGLGYYSTSTEERFYHPDHQSLKPSGIMGHGLGIIGSTLILTGVFSYMARKRYKSMARWGKVKHWMEFHIFLCTMGPIMILFHTAFKFGGIVAISFWSMVAVFLSGIIGRFIYIQIPRTIEGRELSLSEVRGMKEDISSVLQKDFDLDQESQGLILEATLKAGDSKQKNGFFSFFSNYFEDIKTRQKIKKSLNKKNLSDIERKNIIALVADEISLSRKIERLQTMQNLFKYWHVAHLPFALVMLIIMIIHVIVTIVFGYRWIF